MNEIVKKDSSRIMREARISKLLVLYSLPVFFSYICNSIDNIICRAFLGNGSAGYLGNAALGVAFPITLVVLAFAFLFGMGGSTLAASLVGEGKKEDANRAMNQSMQLLLMVGIVVTVFANIFLDQLLILFGSSQEVLPYARDYARVLVSCSMFQLVSVGMTNYMRVEGKTGLAMLAVILGPIVNFCLCILFIRILDMGTRGAALATVTGHFSNTMVVLIYYARSKGMFHFNRNLLRFDPKLVARIAYLGLSAFCLQVCQGLVSIFLNRVAKQYGGDFAVSGMSVVTTIQTFILTIASAVNMGSQSLIAYNYGAKYYSRVCKLIKTAIISVVLIVLLEYMILLLFTEPIASIFGKTKEVVEFSSKALIIYLMMSPLAPVQIQGSGFFQAIKEPVVATLLSLSRQAIILAPMLLLLPRLFNGINGMFYAGPIADLGSVILTLALLLPRLRKLKALPDGEQAT